MSKLIKKIRLKDMKGGKTELLYDGKWHKDDKTFDDLDNYLKYCKKLKEEKLKKMTPQKREALKEKEKREQLKQKLEEIKRKEKFAKQRSQKGYADCDVWSIDYWFLDIIPKLIDELIKNQNGFQPYLGYKIEKGKLVKLKKIKTKDKYSGKTLMLYPEITFKEHQEVLKYLSKGFKQLYAYLNMDDLDYKKNYNHKDYKERNKKIKDLHNETFNLFRDIFYSLWW